jgi:hypothetical protein
VSTSFAEDPSTANRITDKLEEAMARRLPEELHETLRELILFDPHSMRLVLINFIVLWS